MAVQYLKSAGAIRAVRRGVYQITDRALLKEKPSEITVKTLRQPIQTSRACIFQAGEVQSRQANSRS